MRGLKRRRGKRRGLHAGGRTPHGVRGLKLDRVPAELVHTGRTPHGVRGLKLWSMVVAATGAPRRTPHGVRGLKLRPDAQLGRRQASHPSRGAWIET